MTDGAQYTIRPPSITVEEVPAIVEKHYGFTPTSVRKLDGYDDCNFLLKCDGENLSRHGYVFKVINSEDSANPNLIDGFIKAMLHCADRGIVCPVPHKNVYGDYLWLESLDNPDAEDGHTSSNHLIFMLEYIPGTSLGNLNTPISENLAFEVGVNLLAIEDAFRDGFQHDGILKRKFRWDLAEALMVREHLNIHQDDTNKNIMKSILDAFEEEVVPRYPNLPSGFIHGDFNDFNIIVEVDQQGVQHYHGIIDFADISYSRYIFELGTSLMYLMMYTDDPISIGGHVIAGYCKDHPLNDDEWVALPITVAVRYAMSLTYGAVANSRDPDNLYLLSTQDKGWTSLKKFWAKPRSEIIESWKSIVKSYGTVAGN